MKGFVKLSEVAATTQGGKLKLTGKDFVDVGYPAFGAGGINGSVKVREFDKNAVVLSAIGARCGKCFLAEGGWTSLANTRLIFPDERRVDVRFLWYQLNDEASWPRSGAAQPFIRPSDVGNRPVFLPPLEVQQRIVAVLDEAFEGLSRARAHAEANLQNARELFGNFLGAVFSKTDRNWKTAKLDQLVEDDCTLSYGIVQPGDEVTGGLPIVRPTDLGERIITLDGLKKIDPENARGYARTLLKGGEILLCVRGSTGVVAMASEELAGANVTRGIVPVRFAPSQMNQQLGYYQFLSKPIQDQIKAGTYGAALMQINIRDLRLMSFVAPPLDQQSALVAQLDSMAGDFDRLIENYSDKVAEIEALRKSVLQKAFAGELTG